MLNGKMPAGGHSVAHQYDSANIEVQRLSTFEQLQLLHLLLYELKTCRNTSQWGYNIVLNLC